MAATTSSAEITQDAKMKNSWNIINEKSLEIISDNQQELQNSVSLKPGCTNFAVLNASSNELAAGGTHKHQNEEQVRKVLELTNEQATGTGIDLWNQNFVDKENGCPEEQLGREVHKYDNKYDLDATLMSASADTLSPSPMCVDRSSKVSELFDDSNSKETAELSEDDKKLSHNDSQRVFITIKPLNTLQSFYENEKKHRPKPDYMHRQIAILLSFHLLIWLWLAICAIYLYGLLY